MLEDNQQPWLMIIEFDYGRRYYHEICYGTLISYKAVVTTATCVKKFQPHELFVHPNITYWDKTRVRVRQKKIPNEYFLKTFEGFEHDIALLVLEDSLDFVSKIRPACVPNVHLSKTYQYYIPKPRVSAMSSWYELPNLLSVNILSRKYSQCIRKFFQILQKILNC